MELENLMRDPVEDFSRRTTTDAVYEKLHDEITSLEILPGTKLSEIEVARRFGVSRQPVRNAFTKLGNKDLLLIRPQKATEVRGFSIERIALARLVRLSVELEVARRAIEVWNQEREDKVAECLERQECAIRQRDMPEFHSLDYEFHKLICDLSGNPFAFEVVSDCKKKVDRLCVLSLTKDSEASSVLADHRMIANAFASGDIEKTLESIRSHLSRLDETIEFIHKTHPNYFE